MTLYVHFSSSFYTSFSLCLSLYLSLCFSLSFYLSLSLCLHFCFSLSLSFFVVAFVFQKNDTTLASQGALEFVTVIMESKSVRTWATKCIQKSKLKSNLNLPQRWTLETQQSRKIKWSQRCRFFLRQHSIFNFQTKLETWALTWCLSITSNFFCFTCNNNNVKKCNNQMQEI